MSQKALFLDRDGVINVEKNYLYKKENFEFTNGIFDLCKHFQTLGYLIIVVTNQSGIARAMYSEMDFSMLTFWMLEQFDKEGVTIDQVYYCPHHPDISGPCECRKPNPGMLLQANAEFDIDLEHSIMIGDKERDIEAGHNAGVTNTYLFCDEDDIKSSASHVVQSLEEIWMVD